jgi:hypothetical protein
VILGSLESKLKRTSKIIKTDFAIVLTVANGEIVRFQMWKTASPSPRRHAADGVFGESHGRQPAGWRASIIPKVCVDRLVAAHSVGRFIHSCSTTRLKLVRYSRVTLASVADSMLDSSSEL